MASQDKAKSEDGCDQKMPSGDTVSEKLPPPETPTQPPRQIPQSDSGIFLTPLSQTSMLSPQLTETVQEVLEDQSDVGGRQLSSSASVASPADLINQNSSPPPNASAVNHHGGSIPGNDGRTPTSDHGSMMSPRASKGSSSPSPDDFTYQTKYLVLQFLHNSTTENNFLPSMSTTSESEPRCKSYAERLRKQWQRNRSQSSPTSPHLRTRPKPPKIKGSRSSPDLKDANFFKDMPQRRKHKPKRPQPPKPATRGSRKSSAQIKLSPVQTVAAAALIRSVSENTENSETGTYVSDADDELDTSFDSSHQGSTTSTSFRNKLAHYHHQAFRTSLPTVQSETESVTEVPLGVAEESIVESGSPLPIMDVSSVEHQPVLTADQYFRVTNYLEDQMRESLADTGSRSSDVPQVEGGFSPVPAPENEEEKEEEEEEEEVITETNPPEHFLSQHDEVMAGHAQLPDQIEDGAVSGGFEPNSTSACLPEETEGAWGGVDVDDVRGVTNDETEFGRRADRSRLRLDIISDQEAVVLIEAVHSLRQDIEEEISSFESELDEALQSHNSDLSWSMHALNRCQSGSPETAEIARRLARIGDEVQQKYFDHLDRAVGRLFLDNCAGLFTYENFREAALMALDADVHGWQQVATVLLYSQHVALHLAQSGRHVLHKVVDYTVRLLADTAANFIINQGGWASISAMDRSSTPSSPEPSGIIPPTFHHLGPVPGSITTIHLPPTTPDSHLSRSRRSISAPDLHTTPPGESRTPTNSMTFAGPSPQGQASTSASASTVQVSPSQSSPPGQKDEKDGRGNTEEEESDGISAETGDGEADPNGTNGAASADDGTDFGVSTATVLTGCAVSVALIGVGVAVALNLIRG